MSQANIPADPKVPKQPITGTASIWFGVLGAPAAWLIQFLLNYALIPWACPKPWLMTLIRVANVGFLVAVAACGAVCWRDWVRAGRKWPTGSEEGEVPRVRFVAVLGIMSCGLYFTIMLAQGFALFAFNPCWE